MYFGYVQRLVKDIFVIAKVSEISDPGDKEVLDRYQCFMLNQPVWLPQGKGLVTG